jgi:hypothetical protein
MRLRLKGINSRNLPAHPQVIVGARAKNRFRKLIGITGTRFTRKRKRRSGNWINGANIAYLSEPKDFTPNYESAAAKLSLDWSIEEAHEPNLSSPSE